VTRAEQSLKREPQRRVAAPRRAQLAISFHFIYALVGGLLFLLFFFVLIRNVTTTSNEQDVRTLSFQVESILKTAASTPDTFTVSRLPRHDYRFVCEKDAQGMFSYVRIDRGSVTDQHVFDHTPLFAPALVKGDRLFTLTRTWEAPFPITSLLVASNNRTRYLIVDSQPAIAQGSVEEFIKEENLQGFNIKPLSKLSMGDLVDEGFDAYRFIFFDGTVQQIPSTLRAKSSALVVHRQGLGGTLDFYDHLSATTPVASAHNVPYVGDAMLTAAIVSDTRGFVCNRAKAYEKLDASLTILKKRLVMIQNPPPNPEPADWDSCTTIYRRATGLLTSFQRAPNSAFAQAINQAGPLPKLERLNRELLNHQGCPLLY